MTRFKLDVVSLIKVREMLRGSVHAKGCETTTKCPNSCPCRNERPFKLNTETAMCWVMADLISEILRSKHSRKTHEGLCLQIESLSILCNYHMTEGWIYFFENVKQTVERTGNDWYNETIINGDIENMKRSLSRLKREPR